jgi:hypothetical protein
MPLATANAPNASAPTIVAFRRERTPKPKNKSIAQETTTPISGQEIELASCKDMSSRVCWKDWELAPMGDISCV